MTEQPPCAPQALGNLQACVAAVGECGERPDPHAREQRCMREPRRRRVVAPFRRPADEDRWIGRCDAMTLGLGPVDRAMNEPDELLLGSPDGSGEPREN